jgi:hypothetical protein
MVLGLLAKDDFPLLFVARWAFQAELHETITPACRREAIKTGLAGLESAIGLPTNSNEPTVHRALNRPFGVLTS